MRRLRRPPLGAHFLRQSAVHEAREGRLLSLTETLLEVFDERRAFEHVTRL
jgi:hypothetical protein